MDALYLRSFTSINSLHKKALSEGLRVTRKDVKEFLEGKRSYTLHKQTRKKFPRNKIKVIAINEQWSIDLASMKNPAVNRGMKWVSTFVTHSCYVCY